MFNFRFGRVKPMVALSLSVIAGLAVFAGYFYLPFDKAMPKDLMPDEEAASDGIAVPKNELVQKDEVSDPSVSLTSRTTGSAKNETADWDVYVNKKYGFEIKHPKDYRVVMEDENLGSVKFGFAEPFFILQAMNNPRGYGLEDFYRFYGSPDNKDAKNSEVSEETVVVDLFKEADSKSDFAVNGISTYKFNTSLYDIVPIPGKNKIVEAIIPFDPYKQYVYDELTSEQKEIVDDFREYEKMYELMFSTFRFTD